VVVIKRQEAHGRPLSALLRTQRWFTITRFFGRFWASMLLVLSALTGLVLIGIGHFDWKDYVLGLIVPIGLLILQEAQKRRKPPTSAPRI
jgi:hypothetical protein